MKKFIQRIIIFFTIIISVALLLICFISRTHHYLPNNMYYNEEFNKAFSEKDFELITIGNSKLLASLDKDILEKNLGLKTAMLGYSSSNISISKITFESYINQCIIKPKLVILEVSWITFNLKRTTFHSISGDIFLRDPKLWNQLKRYYPEIALNLKKSILKQIESKFRTAESINFGERKEKKQLHNKKNYTFSLSDFEKIFPTHTAGIDEKMLKDFYDIVELCKKNNVILIMYSAPEDLEYCMNQKDRKEIMKIFYNVKNNRNVFFLDYTLGGSLWDKSFEFWLSDSHHIYEKELFTQKFISDIKTNLQSYKLHY